MGVVFMAEPKTFTDPMWTDVPSALSTEEAAALLRVHLNTVKKLITEKKLPAQKIGRAYRVNKIDLMRYMGMIVDGDE